MYGFTPSATTENVAQPAAREQVEQAEQRVAAGRSCASCAWLMPGHRHGGQQAEDDQHAEDVQDPPPDVRRPEGIEQGLEHGSGVVAGRSSRPRRMPPVGSASGASSAVGSRPRPWAPWPWAPSPLGLGRLGVGRPWRIRLGGLGLGRSRPRRGLGRRGLGDRSVSAAGASSAAGAASATGASAGAAAGAASAAASASAGRARRRRRRVPRAASSGPRGRSRCRRPPRSWRRADAVNASATTKSGADSSPAPRILSGLSRVRTSPTARRMSWLIVIGVARPSPCPWRPWAPRLERAALDERADGADVHDLVLDLEAVLEAAQLRDAHVERGLAALEPGRDRAAGTGLLALGAAAGRLALAGGDAAADARARPVWSPSGGRRSWSFMPSPGRRDALTPSRDLLDGHEEADLADHAAGRGVVGDRRWCCRCRAARARGRSPGCARCG